MVEAEMKESPYSRFARDELILRDELAIDRTLLANERTLLAYLRAGVALGIAGVSIMHFAAHDWFRVIGILCVPTGILTAIVGILRYRRVDRAITRLRKQFQAVQQANPATRDEELREDALKTVEDTEGGTGLL